MDPAKFTRQDSVDRLNSVFLSFVQSNLTQLELWQRGNESEVEHAENRIKARKESLKHYRILRDGNATQFARAYSNKKWSGPEDVIEHIRQLT